jgi:exonuclease SbcD
MDDYALHTVNTKRGDVAVGAAPYPMPAWLLRGDNVITNSVTDADLRLQEVLSVKLEDLAEQADALAMPRMLVGHFTVSGAVVGSERNIMLGRDVSVPLSALADDRWDYVALGHIHKHQNLTANRDGAPPVVYSGSMERIDFGEEGDPKGFCWVELARGHTQWRFVRVNARPFITLRYDLRTSDNPTQEIIEELSRLDVQGAVVRLIIKLTPETEARLNETAIRRELERKGAFHVAALIKDLEQQARLRLGGSPEGLTPAELLDRYLQSNNVSAERRATLLNAAESIFQRARQRGES